MTKFVIELHNQKITEIGVRAIIDFYRTIAIDQLLISDLNAFATGADSSSLNVVIDTRENADFNSDIVSTIEDFFKKHQAPWGWFITAIAKSDNIEKYGFNLLYETPAMYFDLANTLPEIKNIMQIKEKTDDLKEWIEPLLEGFPSANGKDNDVYRKLNADLLSKGEKKLRHFTLYKNNDAACSGTLFLSDDSVMIHNVATKNKFKNCGFGSALTLYMMSEAKKLNYKHCFLDSSNKAFNLYHRLGFKTYGKTLVYSIDNKK